MNYNFYYGISPLFLFPSCVLFSRSFFPVQCMMFKATYSPADANNKRKETKWAGIFSMQMSVEMDGLEEPDSSHTWGSHYIWGPWLGFTGDAQGHLPPA